jgi:hypothetical protein
MAELLGTQIAVTSTPIFEGGAEGLRSLDSNQRAAKIGDMVPIAFGKRVGSSGGVLVSPPATEARFETFTEDTILHVRAYYQLVISEGVIDPIQVRDVFQQSCRVGTSTYAYNTRSGEWTPGNTVDSSVDAPRFCGTGGTYSNMTMLSFVNAIPAAFDQWRRQVHCFIRGGIHVQRLLDNTLGSSNNYADLALYLLRNSSRLDEQLIDFDAFKDAAVFLNANSLRCDCLIDKNQNMGAWLQDSAPLFLLRRVRNGGKEGLRPLVPTNANGTIKTGFVRWVHTFTNQDILPDGMDIKYTPLADRRPFAALMMWRQQPDDDIGLARTTEVRYAGTAEAGPYEQHDLTEYVTNENHAVKVGAYILARRRFIEHSLTLRVAPGVFYGSLRAGDIVRVRHTSQDSEGGEIIHDYLYEVEQINQTFTGGVQLELTHFPIDADGKSLIALAVANAVGNGVLLPTGREAVSCDLNDPTNSNPLENLPTPDWSFDLGDVDIGFDEWDYGNEELGLGDFSPSDELWNDSFSSDGSSGSDGQATIELSDIEVRYKRNNPAEFRPGGILDPPYAVVTGKVTSSVAPQINLNVNIEYLFSGTFGRITATIPRIIVKEEPAEGDPPPETPEAKFQLRIEAISDPFDCEQGSLQCTGWSGGGFPDAIFDENGDALPFFELPESPESFEVCPYVGTITANNFKLEENGATAELTVDKWPIFTPLKLTFSIGPKEWSYTLANGFTWTGDGPEGPQPVTYERTFPTFLTGRFFAGGWEWDMILYDWRYNGYGEAPGDPPELPDPEEALKLELELELPDGFDKDRDAIRIIQTEGGFASHNSPGSLYEPEDEPNIVFIMITWTGGENNDVVVFQNWTAPFGGDAIYWGVTNLFTDSQTTDYSANDKVTYVWVLDLPEDETARSSILAKVLEFGDPDWTFPSSSYLVENRDGSNPGSDRSQLIATSHLDLAANVTRLEPFTGLLRYGSLSGVVETIEFSVASGSDPTRVNVTWPTS